MEYIKTYNDDFTCNETKYAANSSNQSTFVTVIENNLNNISNLSNKTDELRCIDEELNQLRNIDENMNDVELVNIGDIKSEILRAMILQLQEEVVSLKDDIKFMRNEMTHKNELLSILARQSIRTSSGKPDYIPNESSVLLHDLMNYEKSDSNDQIEISDVEENVLSGLYESSSYEENKSFETYDKSCGDDISSNNQSKLFVPVENLAKIVDSEELSFNKVKNDEGYHQFTDNRKGLSTDFGAWEQHTTAFGSKMLKRMGYSGGGLGKSGKGIVTPIKANNTRLIGKPEFRATNKTHPWPKGTTLIAGSSILMGIQERKLRKYKAKVRAFPGATIDDLYDYLNPLLKKKPSNIILHIGSNDSLDKTAQEIATEIIYLKAYIESAVPGINIFWSCPVLRTDNRNANSVLRELSQWLKFFSNNVIDNCNIDVSCIGHKGLHLNEKGSSCLAVNFISQMKGL